MDEALGWEKVLFGYCGPGQINGHTCNSQGEFIYVFSGRGNDHRLTNRLHVLNTGTFSKYFISLMIFYHEWLKRCILSDLCYYVLGGTQCDWYTTNPKNWS